MRLTKLSAQEASIEAVRILGLDAGSLGITSTEVLAASLRRVASFSCPTSPGALVDAVLNAVRPLTTTEVVRDEVMQLLEQMVASGDLLELREGGTRGTRLLYLAPPSYIERYPGSYLLLGIRPYGVPLLPDLTSLSTDYEGHTRLLTADITAGPKQLQAQGLRPIKRERWVSSPAAEAPGLLLERYRARLESAPQAGEIEGLVILDPEAQVRFYRGRWRAPVRTDTGDFVARRPQAYGADLWCLVRIQGGTAQRLLELPLEDPLLPGRDEAWRYQAATDAVRKNPQLCRVRQLDASDARTFDFFSPLPGFAERYMQLAGMPLEKARGALFSFRVPGAAASTTAEFLAQMLWMTQEEATSGV